MKEQDIKSFFERIPLFSQIERSRYYSELGLTIKALSKGGVIIQYTNSSGSRYFANVCNVRHYNEEIKKYKQTMIKDLLKK